jgi:hypothetical protein
MRPKAGVEISLDLMARLSSPWPRSKAAASRLRQARQLKFRTRGTILVLDSPWSLATRAQRKARSKMPQLRHKVIRLAEKTKLKPAARRANRAA